MKNKISKKSIIDLIVKKAKGYVYYEEQYEFEKTQNSAKNAEKIDKNYNLFEFLENNKNFDMGINDSSKVSDKIEVQGKTEDFDDPPKSFSSNGLTLVKKKVTSHYVSPDMSAIKILLDLTNERDSDDLESLSDEELLKLRNQLIEEIKNENLTD